MDIVRKERLKLIESISSTIGDSVTRTNELVRKLGWDGESKKVQKESAGTRHLVA